MEIRILPTDAADRFNGEAQLMQICFVVQDLEEAMASFSKLIGAGPWFKSARSPEGQDRTTLRGCRSPLNADIALAYASGTMYELVQPEPGSTSIFSEWVEKHGYGLHHLGFATTQFDKLAQDIKQAGEPVVMTSVTPRGARVLMVEAKGPLNALYELIEVLPASEAFYRRMREASEGWDGVTLLAS